MPLQNRVDPFGEIHAVPARGMFTGNRGVIHDPATKTLLKRRWTTRAWILCECDFRGRRREVMGRNSPTGGAGWTELFFLDEATALAAGHRPCFYCRRDRATEFARCFAAGQGRETITAPEMDAVLYKERWASRQGHDRDGGIPGSSLSALPAGAMVAANGQAYGKSDAGWLEWSFQRWLPASEPAADAVLLTPGSTVRALTQGYAPVWHPSAG
ncbi:hypothetical protein [Mesorhizobium sp. J428]|uniref:hypothetical protein n=1 Tax=Mesorhizobium sp. J428 TaxID=2898440 RepID=UPI00215088E9|nr:hypothetical protein [Mesorhizobium sp. J428]MCR5858488.1 hypothetical protein [Mesorhizobium sp. J428]